MPTGSFRRTWAAMSREWICPCGRIERHDPGQALRAGWDVFGWCGVPGTTCPTCAENR